MTPAPIAFAALGDSITFGVGDPLPGSGWRGWASLLAAALAPPGGVRLHNVATCGARIVDLPGEQLTAALRVQPRLASVVAGVNDTLRGTFDIVTVRAALT